MAISKIDENLHFKPDYYEITKLVEPNVIEVDGTWFIKLKGVDDSNPEKDIQKWLKKTNIVRVIPYRRDNHARIISDVWLGNIHINQQFSNYKRDNFIQAFEYWESLGLENFSLQAENEMIGAFYRLESEIKHHLKDSFKDWMDSRDPQRVDSEPSSIIDNKESLRNQMIKDFNEWKQHIL